GLQVRSVPHDGELPQLFETVEPLTARAEWNAMRPLMAWPQILTAEAQEITLTGDGARLNMGDAIVLMRRDEATGRMAPVAAGGAGGFLRRVSGLGAGITGRRIVALRTDPASAPPYQPPAAPAPAVWAAGTAISTLAMVSALAGHSWSVAALAPASNFHSLSMQELQQAVTASSFAPIGPIQPHLLRVRAGFFGNTANVKLLPTAAGIAAPGAITSTAAIINDTVPQTLALLYLDREYPEITVGQGLLIRSPSAEVWVQIHAAETVGVEAYGQSAKVTRLTVDGAGRTPEGTKSALSMFSIRRSLALALPEPLALADLPITQDIGAASGGTGANQIELATPELALMPGKTLAITGERADLRGVMAAEIRTIAENIIVQEHSRLTLTQPLLHRYIRDTVRICANVAQASHGETVAEPLGDGDATRTFQRFRLKSGPLTHVSARNLRGMAPALEIRVNRVRWDLVDDFRDAGPADRVYILRLDDAGGAHVIFGDGIRGARLPTGQGNIEALYRRGAGLSGHLEAGQLSLLASKPQGLKGVTNPLPPAGGADAETLEDARRNAPMGVLTLGRAVSLRDYEDFARGFAAIAKARADWTFDGFTRPILVTVAGQGGALLPETGEDMTNLSASLRAAGESDLRVSLRNYRPLGFGVSARLFVNGAHMPADVILAARAALLAAFSFDARDLGQGVSQAQIIATLQAVPGVEGVDLDALYLGTTPSLQPRLRAALGRPDPHGALPVAAELLTLDPARLHLEVAA
ncbi:putative baseplate assembly protein, partial [Paracoccus sp. (in: a-proteobacteria)]|uniref:putative baseplate assembly protein n=1 Tax=Paracoccus sp. TaxID=267 RepID=UPI0035AF1E69